MKEKTKQWLLILSCFLSAGLALSALLASFLNKTEISAGIRSGGTDMFRMFTNDGNIFTAAAALITGVYGLFCMAKKKTMNSRPVYLLRLMSAVSETVIFIIVIAILMPAGMDFLLTGYRMIVLHVVVPLLTAVPFLLLDRRPGNIGKADHFWGGLPVYVYGITALVLCIAKVWTGNQIPYPFFRVYENPLWLTVLSVVGILGATALLSFVMDRFKRFIHHKGEKTNGEKKS